MKRPVRVSIVLFPECDPSILYGVFDTLWAAGRLWDAMRGMPPGQPLFVPRIVGAQDGPLTLCTGVTVVAQDAAADVTDTDIVFVSNVMVSSRDSLHRLDRRLLDWIRRQYERGAHFYCACGGSLVIAEAGLLDGLEATTHWGYADLFRREFPSVSLHPERILVQTGPSQRIVCCGGASSWQDLTLFLVAKHAGAQEAIRLSKIFLYQWHRDGQLPYACMIRNVVHDDAIIRRLQVWIAEHYDKPSLVAELVRRSGLPERSFTRRFKTATGYTPIAYIQALRVEEAKQLLESSDLPVEEVARQVGYQDVVSFRRIFTRDAGMAPSDYRRSFRLPPMVERAAAPVRQEQPARPAARRSRGNRGRMSLGRTAPLRGRTSQ